MIGKGGKDLPETKTRKTQEQKVIKSAAASMR
jgi:hypothetical protein